MRLLNLRLLIAIVIPAFVATGQARSEIPKSMYQDHRVALVIGNAEYNFGPLRNPANDATAMAVTLRELKFEVIEATNLDRRGMLAAIRNFEAHLKKDSVAVFFYAGHGMQIGGINYMIPLGSVMNSEVDVQDEAVDVASVLGRMEDAGTRLNLIILDACRNNPVSRRSRSGSRGLAQVQAPTGTLIAYATAPGQVADDGAGENGLYTSALLKALKVPNISVEQTFKHVLRDVRAASGGRQVPWLASSFEGDFYFSLPDPAEENLTIDAGRDDAQDEVQAGSGSGAGDKPIQIANLQPIIRARIINEIWWTLRDANVRALPTTDSDKLGFLRAGTPISVAATVVDGDWLEIVYNGKVSYLAAFLATKTPPRKPEAKRLEGRARVIDTATIEVDGTLVNIHGIRGLAGAYASRMQQFILEQGDRLICSEQDSGGFICKTPTNVDLAEAALTNGAAQVTANAPEAYAILENEAQFAKRGIWGE